MCKNNGFHAPARVGRSVFFRVRLVRGVQIFEPVGKKLLGRHALGGDFWRSVFVRFSPKTTNAKKWGTNKTGRKSRLPTGG